MNKLGCGILKISLSCLPFSLTAGGWQERVSPVGCRGEYVFVAADTGHEMKMDIGIICKKEGDILQGLR